MTSEQIRTEAIERVAKSSYYDGTMLGEQEWEQLPENVRELRRREAAPAVDALAELLPAHVRYGVRHPVTGEPRFVGEVLEDCEGYAEEFETTVIRQYLGEWVPHE